MTGLRLRQGRNIQLPEASAPGHTVPSRQNPETGLSNHGFSHRFLHPPPGRARWRQCPPPETRFARALIRVLAPSHGTAIAVLLTTLFLPLAGSANWYRPLPGEVLGRDTVLVIHLRVSGVSQERLSATLKAVLPPEVLAERDFTETVVGFDAEFRAPLVSMGVEQATWVINAPESGAFESFVLLPNNPTSDPETREQMSSRIQSLASAAEMSVFPIPGWVVLGTTPELPANAAAVEIDDAVFAEALSRAESDADLVVVYVPSSGLRARSLQGFEAFIGGQEDPGTRAQFANLRPVFESEWILGTVRFGGDPRLRATIGSAEAVKARDLTARLNEFLSTARDLTAVASTADEDPEKHWDPAPLLKMYDALRPTAQGTASAIDLDRTRIQSTVEGTLFMVGLIADGIAQILLKPILNPDRDPAPQGP